MTEHAIVEPSVRAEFYAVAGRIPASASEWEQQQAVFRRWRADARFEVYRQVLDGLLAKDFEAMRPWAAAARAAQELRESGYDFDAWREQREYDRKHANDHLP